MRKYVLLTSVFAIGLGLNLYRSKGQCGEIVIRQCGSCSNSPAVCGCFLATEENNFCSWNQAGSVIRPNYYEDLQGACTCTGCDYPYCVCLLLQCAESTGNTEPIHCAYYWTCPGTCQWSSDCHETRGAFVPSCADGQKPVLRACPTGCEYCTY